jgi:methylglutaconyl-CoA hydratase
MSEPRIISARPVPAVIRLTLNRPEVHNAFDRTMVADLTSALLAAAADGTVRAVMIAAAGASFCAGGDLSDMRRAAAAGTAENRTDAEALGAMFKTLTELPKPTLALVHGDAFGGGIGVMAASDIVLAVRGARFALTEVRLGLAPAVISPHVIAAVGRRQAQRYMLTAERFDADEARRIGLVHEVFDDRASAETAAAAMLARLAANGPVALARTKAVIRRVAGRVLDAGLVAETAAVIAELRASPEGREGLAAFFEKRKPSWDAS